MWPDKGLNPCTNGYHISNITATLNNSYMLSLGQHYVHIHDHTMTTHHTFVTTTTTTTTTRSHKHHVSFF